MNKSFYITTTLPYVNAELHMGHALEFIRADVIARTKKLEGYDVYFNTGTDEHGMKIYEKAVALGLTPQAFVDQSFEQFKASVSIFGMDKDLHFIRTTDTHHEEVAQAFWKRCFDNGYIYKKNYQSKYCVGCESNKTDSELNENGECPDHPGRALEIIEEENYFFKYSAFTEKLTAFYNSRPDFVIPEFRYNEIKAFVSRGLEDFSISRLKSKMPWGLPVPGDEDHVMYVWFDALTNYISTLGNPFGTEEEKENFNKYWVNGTPTQYCGKDNLRFQSAMWQAILMAADLPNSYQIVINGFITADGGLKMSKTLGNVVDPKSVVDEYGTDALRFFLLSEVSSFEDSPFTIERFKDAYNAKLANGIGNLTNRIMKMAEDNLSSPIDMSARISDGTFSKHMSDFNLQKAIDLVWSWIGVLDEKIQSTTPFKLVKTNSEEAKIIITQLVFGLKNIAENLEAFLPETSEKILQAIKENKKPEQPLFLRKD